MEVLTANGVNPSGETVSILTDCRLLERCIHFVGSAAPLIFELLARERRHGQG